jgi:hypothetical protein
MARGSRYTRPGRQAASRAADAVAKLPVCSVLPAITGTPTEGETLTCSDGTWSKSPTFTYQWLRSGNAIAATAATYELTEDDVGETMSCTVKATKTGVSAVATSAATDEVEAAA